VIINKKTGITYNVGIYIRLSREDDDKTNESESIINQKSLLLQYVKENNLKLVEVYVDDGYSGTNFDRPAFNKLISDVEAGKINMVITKDMSRLGRDYIGTGNLIERYFPEKGVRYIAVTDNIDTFIDGSNNDIAPFKAIMNDMYAKDISKKIRSSLRAKQKEGKWVSGRCPFGYDIDPENKNHLVINPEQARVVKDIFKACLNGLSCYKIALKLTNQKVRTPASYYPFEWKSSYNFNYGVWHSKTVKDILINQIYLGSTVQNKRNKINYKIKKVIKNNPKDYIIVKNTHEKIIDEETFYEVQKRIPKNAGRLEKKETHLLDGLLYCHECGHRISVTSRRKKDDKCYTICNYYRTYMKQKLCTTHSNNYDALEKVVINAVKSQFKRYVDVKRIKDNVCIKNLKTDGFEGLKSKMEKLNMEINNITTNLDDAYLDKLNNVIEVKQYDRIKALLTNQLKQRQGELVLLNGECLKSKRLCVSKDEVEKYVNDFLSFNNPSRELIVNLIDRIEIHEDKTIDIKLTYALE